MQILKVHSHKNGQELLESNLPHLLKEVEGIIGDIDASTCLGKLSLELSRQKKWGGLVFAPGVLNRQFKEKLTVSGWQPHRLRFVDQTTLRGADRFREIDYVKERVGLEIQFGKYSFMGYDIFSKMIIFRNKDVIDYGIEIVPVQLMVNRMSTGISAFEHLMIDFLHRGEADIDVPVAVLGISPTNEEWERVENIQELFRNNPEQAREMYPFIPADTSATTKPGPKPL